MSVEGFQLDPYTVGHTSWQSLVGLSSWYLLTLVNLLQIIRYNVPVYMICGHPIFKWVEVIWQGWRDTGYVPPAMANRVTWIIIKWVSSRNCGCLVTWICYQLIVKPGNKTAAVPWLDRYGVVQYNRCKIEFHLVSSEKHDWYILWNIFWNAHYVHLAKHILKSSLCIEEFFCICFSTSERSGGFALFFLGHMCAFKEHLDLRASVSVGFREQIYPFVTRSC